MRIGVRGETLLISKVNYPYTVKYFRVSHVGNLDIKPNFRRKWGENAGMVKYCGL